MVTTRVSTRPRDRNGRWRRRRRSELDLHEPPPAAPHLRRPQFDPSHPVHVTLRLRPGVGSIRNRRCYRAVVEALAAAHLRGPRARQRVLSELGDDPPPGLRVIHHVVLRDHLHLIVEAEGRHELIRGMQGLGIRLARKLNRVLGRKGKLFRERYHARELGTPTEVRRALLYVLNNYRHHRRESEPAWWLDPLSTARFFAGWRPLDARSEKLCKQWIVEEGVDPDPAAVAKPRTWLLTVGWRRGRLAPNEKDVLLDRTRVPGLGGHRG